jgi:hypothetical protein
MPAGAERGGFESADDRATAATVSSSQSIIWLIVLIYVVMNNSASSIASLLLCGLFSFVGLLYVQQESILYHPRPATLQREHALQMNPKVCLRASSVAAQRPSAAPHLRPSLSLPHAGRLAETKNR